MIATKDRSGWFGASDTRWIVGNWGTPSFARWWLEKMGLVRNTFVSTAMMAGTWYEHRVLDAVGVARHDRQIRIPSLRLRVNLDGETFDTIQEVKTFGQDGPFSISKAYLWQCNVQMYAAKMWCQIVAYRLLEEDYRNFFNPIDHERLSTHPISYDPVWVEDNYLPRLEYLAWCLGKRETPDAGRFSA